MSLVLSLTAAAFYSTSSALLWHTLKNRKARAEASVGVVTTESLASAQTATNIFLDHRNLTLLCATMALIIHGWLVIHQTGLPNSLNLPLLTSVSATTLTIVFIHIALCLRQPADYLGLAVYPLAAISLLIHNASAVGTPIVSRAIEVHIFLSLVSYAMLTLAASQAILTSVQRNFLAKHKPGGFMRALPPLDTSERLLFTLLTYGFVLLSTALLSGFIYLDNMFDQRLVHKTILSCVGWGIFGVLLYGRWRFGWRGRKAVHWTLAGFGVLILAYFGSKVVIEFMLG